VPKTTITDHPLEESQGHRDKELVPRSAERGHLGRPRYQARAKDRSCGSWTVRRRRRSSDRRPRLRFTLSDSATHAPHVVSPHTDLRAHGVRPQTARTETRQHPAKPVVDTSRTVTRTSAARSSSASRLASRGGWWARRGSGRWDARSSREIAQRQHATGPPEIPAPRLSALSPENRKRRAARAPCWASGGWRVPRREHGSAEAALLGVLPEVAYLRVVAAGEACRDRDRARAASASSRVVLPGALGRRERSAPAALEPQLTCAAAEYRRPTPHRLDLAQERRCDGARRNEKRARAVAQGSR